MSFTKEQLEQVLRIFNSKITKPCPACGQAGKRRLVKDLFLLQSFQWPVAVVPPIPNYIPPNQIGSQAPGTFILPCIITTCGNCGYTELYNIHILGLAEILGVPPPGTPMY